jgi:hypothetical protein
VTRFAAARSESCVGKSDRRQGGSGPHLDQGRHLRLDVDLEELEEIIYSKIRKKIDDEHEEPSLQEGRRMTVAQLWAAYRAEYVLWPRGIHEPEKVAGVLRRSRRRPR